MNVPRRLQALAERLDAQVPSFEEVPASQQWLTVLKITLPLYEEEPPSSERNVVIRRIRHSIALLDEYLCRDQRTGPWPYLEYFCRACLMRMSYSSQSWRGRELAFLEAEYDQHILQIEQIERSHS